MGDGFLSRRAPSGILYPRSSSPRDRMKKKGDAASEAADYQACCDRRMPRSLNGIKQGIPCIAAILCEYLVEGVAQAVDLPNRDC